MSQLKPATAQDYAGQLAALLPQGAAWPRNQQSALGRLLAAFAEELARVDGRSVALFDEASPDTALELLADWEQFLGLPDSCTPASNTTRERQRSAIRKLASLGGQSRTYFISLAALLGYVIEIEEFAPARIGMRVGDRLNGEAWGHAWRVRMISPEDGFSDKSLVNSSVFRMGSRMGERLRSFSNSALECIIRRAAPAHTVVMFAYDVDPEPTLQFDFVNAPLPQSGE